MLGEKKAQMNRISVFRPIALKESDFLFIASTITIPRACVRSEHFHENCLENNDSSKKICPVVYQSS